MSENSNKRSHRLKTWPEPFQAVAEGRKLFEYRRDDRGFAVGDELVLEEWDPSHYQRDSAVVGHIHHGGFTGRKVRATVAYRLAGEHGVPEGFCVLSLIDVKVIE